MFFLVLSFLLSFLLLVLVSFCFVSYARVILPSPLSFSRFCVFVLCVLHVFFSLFSLHLVLVIRPVSFNVGFFVSF